MLTGATVLDSEIRQFRDHAKPWTPYWQREFAIALGEAWAVNEPLKAQREARDRIAALMNVRAQEGK